MNIFFHKERIEFCIKNEAILIEWLKKIINDHRKETGNINIILTNEKKITELNNTYLNHNYPTDVITFNFNEKNIISGDIYIGIDCVIRNARTNKVLKDNEFSRVVVHGILHLLGYDDKNKKQRENMRRMENKYLEKLEENN